MSNSAITERSEIVSGPGRKIKMFQDSMDIVKDFQKEGFNVSEEVDENGRDYYRVDITENEGKKVTQYKVYSLQDLEDLYENHLPSEKKSEIDENVAKHVDTVSGKVFDHYTSGKFFDLPGYDKDVLIRLLDAVYKNSNCNGYSKKVQEIKSYIEVLRKYDFSATIQYFLDNPIDMVNPYALTDDTMMTIIDSEDEGLLVYTTRNKWSRSITEPEFLENFLESLIYFLDKIRDYERRKSEVNKEEKYKALDVFDERKLAQIICNCSPSFIDSIEKHHYNQEYVLFIQNLELPLGWEIMNMVFTRGASWITQSDKENITKIIQAKPLEFAQYLNDLYSPDTERNLSNRRSWSRLMEEIENHFK